MLDSSSRKIGFLRLSVTDKCTLHCRFCMPDREFEFLPRSAILPYEEIVQVVKVAVDFGITKVRLTGGEPLIKRDIIHLVSASAASTASPFSE